MASNNSSKTAHVMNLLSKNRGAASEPAAEPKAEPAVPQEAPVQQAEAAPQAAPAPQAEPARPAPVAPLISSITADAAVSSQIKDALEAELAEAPKAAPSLPFRRRSLRRGRQLPFSRRHPSRRQLPFRRRPPHRCRRTPPLRRCTWRRKSLLISMSCSFWWTRKRMST